MDGWHIYPECQSCELEKCTLSAPLFNGDDGGCNNPDVMKRLQPVKPFVVVSKEESDQWKSRTVAAEARVRVMEEALRFYADPITHEVPKQRTIGGFRQTDIDRDKGKKAYQALEGGKPDDLPPQG